MTERRRGNLAMGIIDTVDTEWLVSKCRGAPSTLYKSAKRGIFELDFSYKIWYNIEMGIKPQNIENRSTCAALSARSEFHKAGR